MEAAPQAGGHFQPSKAGTSMEVNVWKKLGGKYIGQDGSWRGAAMVVRVAEN